MTKTLKVRLKPPYYKEYVEELKIIEFEFFEKWILFEGYAYDIEMERINAVLDIIKEREDVFQNLKKEIYDDWQDARWLSNTQLIREDLKHPARIAVLMCLIQEEGINPITIDTMSRSVSKAEGHHRLLALKALGFNFFPAYISGYLEQIEKLKPSLAICTPEKAIEELGVLKFLYRLDKLDKLNHCWGEYP